MSKYVFIFDLDSTITKQEILPTISEYFGVFDKMKALTETSMRGEIPFKQSFLHRVDILKNIPVSDVCQLVSEIMLNDRLVEFIQENRGRCYIVTGNLDVWIKLLIKKMEMESHTFCSNALVKNNYIQDVISVVDKNAVVSQMVLPFVAVGDGNNDAEMIEAAEIGIGYGGVRNVASSVLSCASHAVYEEKKLVDFLKRLV